MRANGTGGAGTYSKVPGTNTRHAANNIVGTTPNRGIGVNSKPPAMGGARTGPNVRARANGAGAAARGSSRGGGDPDADQIMSSDHVNKKYGVAAANQRSGSANRRQGASAAAYQAQSNGMGAEALKVACAPKGTRHAS